MTLRNSVHDTLISAALDVMAVATAEPTMAIIAAANWQVRWASPPTRCLMGQHKGVPTLFPFRDSPATGRSRHAILHTLHICDAVRLIQRLDAYDPAIVVDVPDRHRRG